MICCYFPDSPAPEPPSSVVLPVSWLMSPFWSSSGAMTRSRLLDAAAETPSLKTFLSRFDKIQQ